MTGESKVRGNVMDDASATRRNVERELDYPVKVCDLLNHLHHKIEADILEELLVIGIDFTKLGKEVRWDIEGARAWSLLLLLRLDLLFGLSLHRSDASSKVLGLIHLLDLLVV